MMEGAGEGEGEGNTEFLGLGLGSGGVEWDEVLQRSGWGGEKT